MDIHKLSRAVMVAAAVAVAAGGASIFHARRARRAREAAVARKPNPSPVSTRPPPLVAAETVFEGRFGEGWDDWGWGPHEIADGGPARIVFAGFGGIILHHAELSPRFGALVIRFRAPRTFGDFLEVALQAPQVDEKVLPRIALDARYLSDTPDGWREAVVPFRVLDPTGLPFDRIAIRARRWVGNDWVLVDKILLTRPDPDGAALPTPSKSVRLSIDCDKPSTPISPLIYGIAAGVETTGETAHRVGGNAMSRLNWDLGNAWNTGSDWFFENVKGDSSLWDWIDETVSHHLKMAVVVPMLGWVAKDTTSVGFPITPEIPQRSHDPKRPEAGDGFSPNGKPLTPGPATTTSVAAPPEVIHRWIEIARKKDAERGARGIDMYILDNEPALWNTTHRDVHPDPVGYDELLDRTIEYGTAIRTADPDAVIAGPASWGWSGYFYSAKDAAAGFLLHPDRRAHGGIPLLPWYLQQLADHERKTGVRILDVVDVHFYPQAPGIYGPKARTDPEGSALRLRSTRALWDPEYVDESWIKEPVDLIPRLKEWVAKNYPGRGISLGEWSFGAEEHISGGLAIAEALGRFGQQGLTAAFYWRTLSPGTPGYWAFRAYRNFDGSGGRFLDESVPTTTQPGTSLFASRNPTGDHIVAIALNLDAVASADALIDTRACGPIRSVRAFSFGAGSTALAPHDVKVEKGTSITDLLPPYSIEVLDLRLDRNSDGD